MNRFIFHNVRTLVAKKIAIFLISISFLFIFGVRSLYFNTIEASSVYIPGEEEYIFSLTNSERIKNGVSPLGWDYNLYLAARAKANHMFKHDYFEHIAPDGTTPWDFIEGSGYTYLVAGENLAIDFYNYSDLMKAWMESPKHKENIIDDEFLNIGIAVVRGEFNDRDTVIVVQIFGYPDK